MPISLLTQFAKATTPSLGLDSLARIGWWLLLMWVTLILASTISLFQPLTRYRLWKMYPSNQR